MQVRVLRVLGHCICSTPTSVISAFDGLFFRFTGCFVLYAVDAANNRLFSLFSRVSFFILRFAILRQNIAGDAGATVDGELAERWCAAANLLCSFTRVFSYRGTWGCSFVGTSGRNRAKTLASRGTSLWYCHFSSVRCLKLLLLRCRLSRSPLQAIMDLITVSIACSYRDNAPSS